jgi:hypothetical protein
MDGSKPLISLKISFLCTDINATYSTSPPAGYDGGFRFVSLSWGSPSGSLGMVLNFRDTSGNSVTGSIAVPIPSFAASPSGGAFIGGLDSATPLPSSAPVNALNLRVSEIRIWNVTKTFDTNPVVNRPDYVCSLLGTESSLTHYYRFLPSSTAANSVSGGAALTMRNIAFAPSHVGTDNFYQPNFSPLLIDAKIQIASDFSNAGALVDIPFYSRPKSSSGGSRTSKASTRFRLE